MTSLPFRYELNTNLLTYYLQCLRGKSHFIFMSICAWQVKELYRFIDDKYTIRSIVCEASCNRVNRVICVTQVTQVTQVI